jgi:hypothetical protein
VVLKVIQAADGHTEPTSPGYWKREPLVYESGVLENLPPGCAVPECFALAAPSREIMWLWLEDIATVHDSALPLPRYGLAARHLGRFNGLYLGNVPCPSFSWLRRDYLRSWVALGGPGMGQLPGVLDRPLVAHVYSGSVATRLVHRWEERDGLLATLASLPQTFCHMDAMRRNMIARHDAHGQRQTVLLDWGEAGLGAPGEDLAAFITGSVFLDAETPHARELEDIALESYIDGLRDVGWRGDAELVRRGYAIAAVLRILGGTTWVLHTLLNDGQHGELERAFGRPIHELVDRWAGAMKVAVEALDKVRH